MSARLLIESMDSMMNVFFISLRQKTIQPEVMENIQRLLQYDANMRNHR